MPQQSRDMPQIQQMIALLREAARLVPDCPAFQTICAASLRQGRDSDYLTGKRDLHNRRRAWLRLFRHFAPLHGIRSTLCIRVVDRMGEYVCELVAKPDRGPAWRELVLRAREFGIYENELEGLALRAEKRKRSITHSGA